MHLSQIAFFPPLLYMLILPTHALQIQGPTWPYSACPPRSSEKGLNGNSHRPRHAYDSCIIWSAMWYALWVKNMIYHMIYHIMQAMKFLVIHHLIHMTWYIIWYIIWNQGLQGLQAPCWRVNGRVARAASSLLNIELQGLQAFGKGCKLPAELLSDITSPKTKG